MFNIKDKTLPPITEQDFIDDGYEIETIAQIQPQGGIDFKERYFRTGNGYTTAITIYELPKILNDNWLDAIVNQTGVVAIFDTISIDRHESIKKINRSIGEQATRKWEQNAKTLDKLEAEDSYNSLLNLGANIKLHGEVMKRVMIRLFLTKSTEQELEVFVKKIKKELESRSFKAQLMQFESKDNYLSMFYSYEQQKTMLNHFRKGCPIQAGQLAGSYYFNHQELLDERGTYLGNTMTNGSVIYDPFKFDEVRTFFNILVLGKMGMGKSTLLKMIEEDQFARGNFIRGFDKARDFAPMIKEQGGKIICLDGTDGCINMLQIFASASISESDLRVSQVNSYKIHLDKLKMQFKLLNSDLSETDLKMVKSAFDEFYVDYGLINKSLGENQNITDLPNNKYPTLSQFRQFFNNTYKQKVFSQEATERRRNGFENIEATLNELCDSYSEIFDGITTIENMEDEQVVMFDIEGLTSYDESIKNCMLYTSLQLIWAQAIKNGRKYKNLVESGELHEKYAKRFMFFIDECHNLINSNDEDVVEFIVKFQKEMRKFMAGVIFATQSPQELIPENINAKVEPKLKQVFALTQAKFLLNMEESDVSVVEKALGSVIKESEYRRIPYLKRGQALLNISGSTTMFFNIEPTSQQLARFKGGI
ncbi:ATP-binding protein [Staphylococcus epidermidis]|nr:ATP-binding protein [Staphylococcus epidermidis]